LKCVGIAYFCPLNFINDMSSHETHHHESSLKPNDFRRNLVLAVVYGLAILFVIRLLVGNQDKNMDYKNEKHLESYNFSPAGAWGEMAENAMKQDENGDWKKAEFNNGTQMEEGGCCGKCGMEKECDEKEGKCDNPEACEKKGEEKTEAAAEASHKAETKEDNKKHGH